MAQDEATKDEWTQVDHYIAARLIAPQEAQAATHAANAAAGLPKIDVSPPQGKLLALLVKTVGAKNILEIGTLGGYSTIWMAHALPPSGRIVTLEYEEKHARVARQNFEREGVAAKIDLRVGAALDLLPKIAAEGFGPFDLTFIDADKANNGAYFDWALKLSRPGSLIIVDNVVREGRILDASGANADIAGTRALFDRLSGDARLTATALQTVGSKGWDGFIIARVD